MHRTKIFAFLLRVSPLLLRQLVTHFSTFSSFATLGRAGLEAHGRAGLRRCRAALTLTGLGALRTENAHFPMQFERTSSSDHRGK